jgi:hypothetical protein
VGAAGEGAPGRVSDCVSRWLRKKDTSQCFIDLERWYFLETFSFDAAERL